MDETSSTVNHTIQRKRKRLSTACTRCRSRKVRCDDKLPACTNCEKAGVECVTRDHHQPHLEVERREAQSQTYSSSPPNWIVAKKTSHGRITEDVDLQSYITNESDSPRLGPPNATGQSPQDTNVRELLSRPLPALPNFISGNCLFMLTQWLDLAFARIGRPERFSWPYQANKLRAEHGLFQDISSPGMFFTSFDDDDGTSAVDRFLATVNSIFPVVDVQDPILSPARFTNAFGGVDASTAGSTTRLLILVAGDHLDHTKLDRNQRFLSFAFSRITDLLQDESIYSVTALALMAIIFRGRNDTEMAWRMLANAVAKAQALGLDRRPSAHLRSWAYHLTSHQQLSIWLSLFILDKVLCVELQRSPMIHDCFWDEEIDIIPKGDLQPHIGRRCFHASISLAKIQGKVCERLLACTRGEESGKMTPEQIIRDKLRTGGELDQLLIEWIGNLPSDLRPSEYPSCEPADLSTAAFLALQYYETLFLIHRNALMIKSQKIRAEVESHFPDSTYRFRIQNSPAICSNIARSIVNVLNHVLESGEGSILNSIYAPLISVYTLAIQIMKNPAVGSAKTDLEIQASAMRIITQLSQHNKGHNTMITSTVETLHSQVRTRIYGDFQGTRSQPASALQPLPAPAVDCSLDQPVIDITEITGKRVRPGAGGSVEAATIYDSNQPWLSSAIDTELLSANSDLAGLDWEAIALTIDLPPY